VPTALALLDLRLVLWFLQLIPVAVATEVEAALSETAASEIVEVDEGEPLGDNYDVIDWRRLPDLSPSRAISYLV
jgi:hypothetical protein